MAMPPNITNYTVPGGVKLFFDDGTGERDLGNIVSLDITPGTDELEHYTNRSGKRAKDAVLTLEEKLSLKFKVDEPVLENWQYFLKGGSAELVGEGTASKVDQKLVLDGTKFMSVGAFYGLTSVSVRSFIDYCFVYEASAFVDNTLEADSAGGVSFEGPNTADVDYLYIGKLTKFKQLYFDVTVGGSYATPKWEFWNGSAWTEFSPTGEADLSQDGTVVFGTLTDWAEKEVNGYTAYWVRFSAGTVTTPVTIAAIRKAAVVNTDFSLDAGQAGAEGRLPGRIARIAAGIFEDGEEVKVSFTYATWTGQRFAISGVSFPTGSARLEVHPSAGRGLQFDIEIPKCQLKPDGNISLDDKKWMEMGITLEVLDNSSLTPTYPYGRFVIYE